MSKVIVYQAENGKAAVVNPFFEKVEKALAAVRQRAYELFEKRGGAPGGDMEDWLQAERDLFFIPEAEVTEDEKGITVRMAAPGFEAADIEVIALPRELLVEAKVVKTDEKGSESKCLYRRFELAAPIDTEKIRAVMDNGRLTIEAPKKMIQVIPVRAAAA